jgi:hypothetical protein
MIVLKGLDLSVVGDVLDHLDNQVIDGHRFNEEFWLASLSVCKESVLVLPLSQTLMRG